MKNRQRIDASIGDPAFPFMAAAQYAMEKSLSTLHQYDNYGSVAHNMAREIMDFFDRELDIKRPNWSGVGLDSYAYTNGITESYDGLLEIFKDETAKYNTLTKQNLKPAIIMPVPTYGIFFAQPEKMGIEVIKLQREADGSVDPQKLLELLRAEDQKGEHHLIAYYDSNPNNPTGHVRNAAETEALADIFIRYNNHMANKKERLCAKMKNPDYSKLRDLNSGMKVIDDMVYMGLEYGDHKASSFLSVKEMYDNTLLLAGGSKIGLTGLCAGVMIGAEPYIYKFKKNRALRQYFPSVVNMHALTPTFPTEPEHLKMRSEHLHKLNAAHLYSGNLLKALINGIDELELNKDTRAQMVEDVATTLKTSRKKALDALKGGIDGVKVITSPQAGFFHLLDYSALKGLHVKKDEHRDDWRYVGQLKDEWDLQEMNRDMGLAFCSGNGCGYELDDMVVRTTFAMPPTDIIHLAQRIRESINIFIKPLQHNCPPSPKT